MDERLKTFGERLQELPDRIKALEDRRTQIDDWTSIVWNKITALEDITAKLEHDLKEIQSSEGMNGHVYHLKGRINTLADITAKLVGQRLPDRVRDLEEWKNHYHILDPDVEKRLKKLEEHEHLRNRVKALEEWKKQHLMFCNEGFGNRDHFDRRLMDLEEWKRDHFLCKEDHGPCPSDTFKIKGNPNQKIKINKQIWEDIKREVAIASDFDEVERLIKKVEPDWNP